MVVWGQKVHIWRVGSDSTQGKRGGVRKYTGIEWGSESIQG